MRRLLLTAAVLTGVVVSPVTAQIRGGAPGAGVRPVATPTASSTTGSTAGADAGIAVRLGVSRAPDTVRVGDPFRVFVRVAAPAGARVDFPAQADSAAPVEVIGGPRQRANPVPDGSVDVTAEYTMAAWTTGAVPVTLDSITVRAGTAVRRVALPPLQIAVRSLLPADSALRVPKPPRDPLPDFGRWWLPYLLAALALVALVAVLVWWARRRRRPAAPVVAGPDAYARAIAGFGDLDRRGLVALGEGGRHVALAVDLARDYLVARIPGVASASQTSGELLGAAQTAPEVPRDALAAVLHAGDLVKFAAARITTRDAERYGTAAREVVETTERAVRAREVAEAAAAAEAAQQAAAERQAYEASRRRAARTDRAA